LGVGPVIAAGLSMVPSGASAQTALPDITVIAPTPVAGNRSAKPGNATAPGDNTGAQSGASAPAAGAAGPKDLTSIDRDKVPSNTEVLTSTDFNHGTSTNFTEALNRGLPGVSLSDQTGNPFQKDLDYRGFTASPVQGTPQGIAVYQNGVRVNEAWGDIVNWDFIPEKAIDKVALFPSNPVFGLNAIGGALSIQMKNGFTWQGTELETFGGSYGRAQSSVQVGRQDGNFSVYGLFESAYDQGFRDFAGESHINRMYVDVGARNEDTEFHISFTGADDIVGNVAATPLDMLNQRWSSVFTWPQDTRLQLGFLQASLTHNFSDTLSFQSNAYYRGFWQAHQDGNGTNAAPCGAGGGAGDAFLCLGSDPLFGTPGVTNVPNPLMNSNAFLGEIDRNWTSSNSVGGTAQLTSTSTVFGHENHLVVGASLDHGYTQFSASSELGTIDPQTFFVQGLGIFMNQPGDDLSTVSVHATNTYAGFYATNTFDVTNRFSITAGARFNIAQIDLQDETGQDPLLNGNNYYQHFNPMVGATYKILPNVTGFADYAISNRAPTPLELGCSSPTTPCQVDNFLVADPPLKQVVSQTVEAGLRGTFGNSAKTGRLTWSLGAFDAINNDDIINVAAETGGPVTNVGFFQNFGKTERKGIEAKADYVNDRWKLYANYSFVDATYQSFGTLSTPASNPAAITDPTTGNTFVNVVPGDHIPGIPAQRLKLGAEYLLTDKWKVGADLNVVGSQYLIHDDTNQSSQVPAYAVLNLHTSYQLTPNVELFGLINNALNSHYYLFGTFVDTGGFTAASLSNQNTLAAFNSNLAYVPAIPFAAYAGVRMTF